MDPNMCLHMKIGMVTGCLLGKSPGSEFSDFDYSIIDGILTFVNVNSLVT